MGQKLSLADFLDRYLPALESRIAAIVDSAGGCSSYDLVRYQLGLMDESGVRLPADQARRHSGKKLRPAITLLSCESVGGDWLRALPAAAAIELIHNFSLVHDDVEDGDRLRRHRLTVWGAFGIPKAVNCGSAMQALVYHAVLDQADALDDGLRLEVVRLLTEAIQEMTEGQHLDLDYQERGRVSIAEYFDMTSRKTGALLEAASRCGARIGGASSDNEDALARFGRSFGLAFQARDDYLGVWGDPGQSGKAVGADILRRKKSIPVAFALEREPEGAGRIVSAVMDQESISSNDCAQVVLALESCGARQFTERAASQYTERAVRSLGELADSPARQALLELSQMAAIRHS